MLGDSHWSRNRYATISCTRPASVRTRRPKLQRLFSTFPGGWPGIGLLLLRVAAGVTAMAQGGAYLTDGASLTLGTCVLGLLAASAGLSLILGFLTPVGGGLVALCAVGVFTWFPAPPRNLFDAALPTILVVVVATAVLFLGPGALSVDARLFGRREIIIPQTSRGPRA